ncbi:bacterial regulatory s, tetR family protein [Mycobacteroides abscessus MAB_030201_1075]|uniref:Bacterial regulatory s, tetR family protein n=1 Tax=Mycobacteroides abscessus MAB_030201_1075 TaxID=1335410 RepID=A0A829PHQ2_9MYCO|nr:bacterial regulatory s, tetR family protein [Mycobacteroides abscessus MAB_030201_1075]
MPRQEREQWILTAAAAEFGESTFAGSSMNGIAARAEVSKALVLAYFGSKEDLYVACVERAGERMAAAIGGALSGETARAEVAEAVLTAIFTALEDRPSDWPVLYDRTVPDGRARDAARRQRTTLRAQAVAAVTRTLGPLVSATTMIFRRRRSFGRAWSQHSWIGGGTTRNALRMRWPGARGGCSPHCRIAPPTAADPPPTSVLLVTCATVVRRPG